MKLISDPFSKDPNEYTIANTNVNENDEGRLIHSNYENTESQQQDQKTSMMDRT